MGLGSADLLVKKPGQSESLGAACQGLVGGARVSAYPQRILRIGEISGIDISCPASYLSHRTLTANVRANYPQGGCVNRDKNPALILIFVLFLVWGAPGVMVAQTASTATGLFEAHTDVGTVLHPGSLAYDAFTQA